MFQPFHEIELRLLCRSYKLFCSWQNMWSPALTISSEAIWKRTKKIYGRRHNLQHVNVLTLVSNDFLDSPFGSLQLGLLRGSSKNHSYAAMHLWSGHWVVISYGDWRTISTRRTLLFKGKHPVHQPGLFFRLLSTSSFHWTHSVWCGRSGALCGHDLLAMKLLDPHG